MGGAGGLVVVAGGDVPAVETEKGGRRATGASKTCSVGTGMSGGYRCRRTNRPQDKGTSRFEGKPSSCHEAPGSAKACSIWGTVLCAAMSAVRSTRACAARRV